MGLIENINQRAKKLGIIDLNLAQGAAMFFTLTIAKLIPGIMDLSIWWFVALLIICEVRPFYVFWIMK